MNLNVVLLGAVSPRGWDSWLPPTVTTHQRLVLQFLAEMKQLTTTHIQRHLHPDRNTTYTRHVLAEIQSALAVYRMVFGQSRQEDLVAYLLVRVPETMIEQAIKNLRINLEPPHSLSSSTLRQPQEVAGELDQRLTDD